MGVVTESVSAASVTRASATGRQGRHRRGLLVTSPVAEDTVEEGGVTSVTTAVASAAATIIHIAAAMAATAASCSKSRNRFPLITQDSQIVQSSNAVEPATLSSSYYTSTQAQ